MTPRNMTAPASDAELGRRVFDNLMKTFFLPEIERRQAEGRLPESPNLRSAQVVLHPDGRPNEVRFNEEVRCEVRVKNGRPDRGRLSHKKDVTAIALMEHTDGESPDWAHATIVLVEDRWHVYFDFRYNKSLAHRNLDAAKQFYRAAALAWQNGLRAPCIDNLHSAAELTVKSELLLAAYPEFRKGTDHQEIKRRFEVPVDSGSQPAGHEAAFIALMQSPFPQRYLRASPKLEDIDIEHLLRTISEMITYAEGRIALPVNHEP
jgi:hypothetical protein